MTARLLLALLLSTTPALASSDDAWQAFRDDVRKACETAVAGRLRKPVVSVDPFGSESYGVAIARGDSTDAKAPRAIVCVYDKRAKRLETSGEFAP